MAVYATVLYRYDNRIDRPGSCSMFTWRWRRLSWWRYSSNLFFLVFWFVSVIDWIGFFSKKIKSSSSPSLLRRVVYIEIDHLNSHFLLDKWLFTNVRSGLYRKEEKQTDISYNYNRNHFNYFFVLKDYPSLYFRSFAI